MTQFYPCGLYQYQLTIVGTDLQPKMVWSPLIATGRVYRLLQAVTSRFAALRQKYNCQSQNTVARCSNFEMLLTDGLYRNSQQWKGPPDKQTGPMASNQRT